MFKSCKGITLTSLVIYIIVLMIVVAIMSTFLGYFQKNTKEIVMKENSDEQFTRLLAYLTKDVNSENLVFIKTGVDTQEDINSNISYLILRFDDGVEHQYLFNNKNESIYYLNCSIQEDKNKKISLCNKVDSSSFTYDEVNHDLTVIVYINSKQYTKVLNVNI